MIQVSVDNDFAVWRKKARRLLEQKISPEEIIWTANGQQSLFEEFSEDAKPNKKLRVSADFLSLAEMVALHSDEGKWSLLYRLLFRLVYENRFLLSIEADEDVRDALLFAGAVNRDVHKFHAFVRFRRVEIDSEEIFIAWHEPAHFTVERAAPFFTRRFGAMRFSILTPKGCAHWDLEHLAFSPGVTSDLAPREDETENFWLAYYASIFNPFRLKEKAMRAQMPVRHWKTLPEASLIPKLVRRAKEIKK